jgi:competence protein ComEA
MSRARWLAALALAAIAVGAALRLRWPSPRPALECDPTEVRWRDAGPGESYAVCAPDEPARPLPAAQGLTLGMKMDLNRIGVDELALLPGIGPSLARAIAAGRERAGPQGFRSWEEVDAVPGVGAAKMETLRKGTFLSH